MALPLHYLAYQKTSTPYSRSLFTTNQVRVFVSDLVGTPSPTVVLTDTKELNFKHTVEVEYSKEDAQQLQVSVKPHYGRVFLSAKCTEHVLTTNKIFEPLTTPFLEYSKCIKSMAVPYTVRTRSSSHSYFIATVKRRIGAILLYQCSRNS